jgi:hypothetical protein
MGPKVSDPTPGGGDIGARAPRIERIVERGPVGRMLASLLAPATRAKDKNVKPNARQAKTPPAEADHERPDPPGRIAQTTTSSVEPANGEQDKAMS